METQNRSVRPLAFVCRDENGVILKLEMPGVAKEAIDLQVDGDVLTVRGRRESFNEDTRFVVRERAHGDYAHSFTLDETIDRERIEAHMENGVLTVNLKLREEQKPRKITVKKEA